MICINDPETNVLGVSEKGYGKRSEVDDYRITNRGGKGVKTMNITEKTGALIAIKSVIDSDDLMIINKSGITIRMSVNQLRIMGRATQGVRLINLRNGDEIAAVAKVEVSEDADVVLDENEILDTNGSVPDSTSEDINNENYPSSEDDVEDEDDITEE